MGTESPTGETEESYESVPMASAMVALFSVSNDGAGAGTTTYGAPKLVGTNMGDIGEADAEGYYSKTDPKGMTVKMQFKKGTDVVYFNMENTFPADHSGIYLYASQSLSVTPTKLGQNANPQEIMALTFPQYIPAMFCKLSDNQPLAWLTISSLAAMQTSSDTIKEFIESNFPDSLTNKITGNIPKGTIDLTLTTSMTQKPTTTQPATMTGGGTITLTTGEVLTVTVSLQIGPNGPIGGTQTFTASTGEVATMTFNADGSMDGTITKNGVVIATIHINADGTGTYTDVATGKTYTISNAA
ncbi:MAG: hypothetical protein AB1349_08415 [Elusimicrobiota bacterium]